MNEMAVRKTAPKHRRNEVNPTIKSLFSKDPVPKFSQSCPLGKMAMRIERAKGRNEKSDIYVAATRRVSRHEFNELIFRV